MHSFIGSISDSRRRPRFPNTFEADEGSRPSAASQKYSALIFDRFLVTGTCSQFPNHLRENLLEQFLLRRTWSVINPNVQSPYKFTVILQSVDRNGHELRDGSSSAPFWLTDYV